MGPESSRPAVEPAETGCSKLEGEPLNRLYGDVWLLERIAESTGVRHDLEVVFEGNGEMVDAVLALTMFPYLTKFSFSRVARWQRIVKSPFDFPLTPRTITALTQSITERHRQECLSLRVKRLKIGELCEVEATNGRSSKAARLKLNLYLNVRRHAEILVRLRIGNESQRKELGAMLGKATLPDGRGR